MTTSGGARGGTLDALFGVDLRSLAAFRVAIALALLYDVADRSQDLVAHYTDAGVLTADAVLAMWGRGIYLSPFFYASGSPVLVGALFAVFAAAAIALLVGWRTRWAALLCWFLLTAVQVRNPFAAAMGGDRFLRIVLFWALFLPLGARASLDARRSGAATGDRLLSVPTAALLLQICAMYWMTGLLKNGETWRDGTALYYALHLDIWVTPLGVWAREQAAWMAVGTWGARWFEILGPFLVFVPVATGPVRCATVLLFAGFHVALAAFLTIGPFPLFCIIAWLAFVPTWFWDVLLPRVWPQAARWAAPAEAGLPPPRTARLAQLAAGALAVYVAALLVVQSGALRGLGVRSLPPAALQIGNLFRINQSWTMFAPDPKRADSWPVFRGLLANRTVVDPLRGAAPFNRKPEFVSATLPSFRWRLFVVYLMGVGSADARFDRLQAGLASYLCRDWNASHPEAKRLEHISVDYWVEITDEREQPPQVITVFDYDCR